MWFTTPAARAWTAGLTAAVVFYDLHHKANPIGPVIMGACRGFVYCASAAAFTGRAGPAVIAAAGVMTVYVYALTRVAKTFPHIRAERVVPWLIAGISVVDGAFIGVWLSPALGCAAAALTLVTRALQRVVPGT
jgi:hypothetical protein